jgi:hypothetical protein
MAVLTAPYETVLAYTTTTMAADAWRSEANQAVDGAANDIKAFRRTGWVNGIKAFGGEQSKRAALDAAAIVLVGAALITIAKSGDLRGELRMHLMMELLGKITKAKKDREKSLLSANGGGFLAKTLQAPTSAVKIGSAVVDAATSGHSMMDRAKELAEKIKKNPHAALVLTLTDDGTRDRVLDLLSRDSDTWNDIQQVFKTAMGTDGDANIQAVLAEMDKNNRNGQEPIQEQQIESAIEQVLSNGATVGDILRAHTAATQAGGGLPFMREMVNKLKDEDPKLLMAGLASLNSTNSAKGDALSAMRDLKIALDEENHHTRTHIPTNLKKKPVAA